MARWKQHAEQDIKQWQEGETRSATVVIDDELPIKTFQIGCGSAYCAFWTGSEARLARHEQIKRLGTQPKGREKGMRRTAGAMPVFRMPPPALPKYQPPIYIYTPGYAAPALPDRSILIELRSNFTE